MKTVETAELPTNEERQKAAAAFDKACQEALVELKEMVLQPIPSIAYRVDRTNIELQTLQKRIIELEVVVRRQRLETLTALTIQVITMGVSICIFLGWLLTHK